MSVFAWIGALAIGLSLGLLGSGGSILTVPVLVYLVGQDPKVAIASALMIVGLISLFSVLPYWRKGLISWRTLLLFAPPGMAGAVAGAWAAHFVSAQLQMLVFAGLMLAAAWLMWRPLKLDDNAPHTPRAWWKIVIDGFVVGVVTGMVGVGGGFLIIPALMLLGGLPVRLAVGTSLVIITLNAFSSFLTYLHVLESLNLSVDWTVIGGISAVGIAGGWLGHHISHRLDQALLRRIFALFLLFMGAFIIYKNGSF